MFRAALVAILVALAVSRGNDGAEGPSRTVLKTESFDRDPGWEGFNNRIVPSRFPTVTQDFGYSPTRFASTAPGEIGGVVTRATRPAYWAAEIAEKTLGDP